MRLTNTVIWSKVICCLLSRGVSVFSLYCDACTVLWACFWAFVEFVGSFILLHIFKSEEFLYLQIFHDKTVFNAQPTLLSKIFLTKEFAAYYSESRFIDGIFKGLRSVTLTGQVCSQAACPLKLENLVGNSLVT